MLERECDILVLDEAYFERVWGGNRLKEVFNKPISGEAPIGEAWLISDHARHSSVVSQGPLAGRSLHDLMAEDAPALLGPDACPTADGRFPLLLKLLDARETLSVQVHPSDEDARRLGETDGGKTEMWYVLASEPGGEIYCGLPDGLDRRGLEKVIAEGDFEGFLKRFPASKGTTVFIPAGTVHALGGGVLLAEIQQNSDVTYRIHDWNRLGPEGRGRELHTAKALEVIPFGESSRGPSRGLRCEEAGHAWTLLAACRHFAAEGVEINGACRRDTAPGSFHLILGESGKLAVSGRHASQTLSPGNALMVAGWASGYGVEGTGSFLDYYVPDLEGELSGRLAVHGYSLDSLAGQ